MPAAPAKGVAACREHRHPDGCGPIPVSGAPYSQAIKAGDFVFVSGQLGLKPADTQISGTIQEGHVARLADATSTIRAERTSRRTDTSFPGGANKCVCPRFRGHLHTVIDEYRRADAHS